MHFSDRKTFEILSAWADGTLVDSEVDALDEQIRRDPEFRAAFLLYMDQHATLATRSPLGERRPAEGLGDVPTPRASIRRMARPSHTLWVLGLSVASIALIACVVTWQVGHSVGGDDGTRPSASKPPLDASDDSVAVLAQVVDASWESKGLAPQVGAPLAPGRLVLKSGLAKFEFYCGATVILEGPADFELISTSKAYCRQGKLRAQVPPEARGFAIGSPRLDLVDLGTEFGMSVGESNRTEVHVFDGVVEVQESGLGRGGTTPHRLTTGAIWRIGEAEGSGQPPAEPQTFVTADILSARANEESRRGLLGWRAASRQLRDDPSLLVYFSFDDPSPTDRVLFNSVKKLHGAGDGTVIGCRKAVGRWPGKGALEFRRVGDRVRLAVPGEFESLSFMTWARIDGVDNRFASLMQTDGFEPGEPHWQVHEDGHVALGVQSPPGVVYKSYNTLPMFNRDETGPWTHLAVVYDKAKGLVSHYINGRTVSREPIAFQTPLRLGAAEIGNWNSAGYSDTRPIRNWNGLIDEFLIFGRPLEEAEIRRHYEVGIPGS